MVKGSAEFVNCQLPFSFGGLSPERTAANALRKLFTFCAVKYTTKAGAGREFAIFALVLTLQNLKPHKKAP